MPFLQEDTWINDQATTHDLSELQDCAIGIDARYFLGSLLDVPPSHEPLFPALDGLTGIESHLNDYLDSFKENEIYPFFIFDGQAVVGQEDVYLKRATAATQKTNGAWDLYGKNNSEGSVAAFGLDQSAMRIEKLFPLLQSLLKQRELHFLVAPYNASAQLAYFEMIDSDQCGGVMGSQELLLYPTKDIIIRAFNFDNKTVSAISKKKVLRSLNVSEPMFIDAMLMSGTSFLNKFPPLLDSSLYTQPSNVGDAVNALRTAEKSVANACGAFHDVLQATDPNWLEKYRKARLAVHNFIYVAESGEVTVHDSEHLTGDNHEYLGLQMPPELFHYLNSGLIGSRILNCITHGQMIVPPTLDGEAPERYRKLVTDQIVPLREQTLGLMIPRVHRGIGHKAIVMRAWFDPKYSYTLNHRGLQTPPSQVVGTWFINSDDLKAHVPSGLTGGPVYRSALVLADDSLVARTIAKEKGIKGIDTQEQICYVAMWRFLHLRGYINDAHKLTSWGNALATTLIAINEGKVPESRLKELEEAALMVFELVRFGLLDGKEANGTVQDEDPSNTTLRLIAQCATLLKLNHQKIGYTGPLSKSLLAFRSLSSTVREADRDLIEGVVASMFMYGQCERERNDYLEISQSLPFLREPDIALGIAMQTFFEEDDGSQDKESRLAKLEDFPKNWVPYAETIVDDFRMAGSFVKAVAQGLRTLKSDLISEADGQIWQKAEKYLDARPF